MNNTKKDETKTAENTYVWTWGLGWGVLIALGMVLYADLLFYFKVFYPEN